MWLVNAFTGYYKHPPAQVRTQIQKVRFVLFLSLEIFGFGSLDVPQYVKRALLNNCCVRPTTQTKCDHNLFIKKQAEVSYRRVYHPCPLVVLKLDDAVAVCASVSCARSSSVGVVEQRWRVDCFK